MEFHLSLRFTHKNEIGIEQTRQTTNIFMRFPCFSILRIFYDSISFSLTFLFVPSAVSVDSMHSQWEKERTCVWIVKIIYQSFVCLFFSHFNLSPSFFFGWFLKKNVFKTDFEWNYHDKFSILELFVFKCWPRTTSKRTICATNWKSLWSWNPPRWWWFKWQFRIVHCNKLIDLQRPPFSGFPTRFEPSHAMF